MDLLSRESSQLLRIHDTTSNIVYAMHGCFCNLLFSPGFLRNWLRSSRCSARVHRKWTAHSSALLEPSVYFLPSDEMSDTVTVSALLVLELTKGKGTQHEQPRDIPTTVQSPTWHLPYKSSKSVSASSSELRHAGSSSISTRMPVRILSSNSVVQNCSVFSRASTLNLTEGG